MRIVRLSLQRYGHLSDEILEFPADRGLHIILGANEAGKSTALEAIADCLFGFAHNTRRAFLHQPNMLQVGLTLQDGAGRQASFVRRKRRTGALTDAAGTVLPEAALAPLLNGMTRDRFETVFGLDAKRLRAGGSAIVTEHGDAGSVILDAQTGVRNLRDLVARLDTEAKTLFGDARTARRINGAVTSVTESRALLGERSLSGAAYQLAQATAVQLTKRLDATLQELRELRAEDGKLERIRRTATPRGVRREALLQLALLGARPVLPPGAAATRTDALDRAEQAGVELDRIRENDLALAQHLATLKPDTVVLELTDSITLVYADRSRIASVLKDRPVQLGRIDAAWEDIDRAGAEIGILERGPALLAKRPSVSSRQAAEGLAAVHSGLTGRHSETKTALRKAEQAVRDARVYAGLRPVPPPHAGLRAAADAARAEGRFEALLAEAVTAAEDATHTARLALSALPVGGVSAAALLEAPVPLVTEMRRLGIALTGAQEALATAEAEAALIDLTLSQTRAALQNLTAAGPVPTAQALSALRTRRDLAWQLVRRQHIDAGPAATADELAQVGVNGPLPAALDRLLPEADALADKRHSDARRTADWERLTSEEVGALARHGPALVRCTDAVRAVADAMAGWRALWVPAGVVPLDPAAMTEWAARRDAALGAERKAAQALAKRDKLQRQRDELLGALRTLMPDTPNATLAATLREADTRLGHLAGQAEAHRIAADKVDMAERANEQAARATGEVEQELAAWQPDWAAAIGALNLPITTLPGAMSHLLTQWTEIARHAQTLNEANRRVAEMDLSLQSRAAALFELARHLGEPVEEQDVLSVYTRLQSAQTADTSLKRITAERLKLAASRTAHEGVRAGTDNKLAALRTLVGAEDDLALLGAIEHAARYDALLATIAGAERDLAVDTNGMTPAGLDQEAEGLDLDAAMARCAEIGTRVEALDAERIAAATDHALHSKAVAEMERGADVFGPAQAIQGGLAQIDDDVVRYMRLRMAHVLLRAGAERHRQEQQGPFLRRAGALFASMTEGRYERLDLDEGQKGEPLIAAVRADGVQCGIEWLSDGTRDQLYLSLRLAAVAGEIEASAPTPFIADDLLTNFDDRRALAALGVLAEFGETTQVILFTHHSHLAAMADLSRTSVHPLPADVAG